MPSRLLSNRRRGAGEERRVVGVARILGKNCLRVPLLSFGKRYWPPESAVGGGSVCSWLSRVSFLGVSGFSEGRLVTVKPGPHPPGSVRGADGPGGSENWRTWAAYGLSLPGESKAREPSVP